MRIPIFGSWLKRQKHRPDPVGDLATDFLQDCRRRGVRPGSVRTPGELLAWLETGEACSGAFDALAEAQAEFFLAAWESVE